MIWLSGVVAVVEWVGAFETEGGWRVGLLGVLDGVGDGRMWSGVR